MTAPDVNLLVYALRSDLPLHAQARRWLEEKLQSGDPLLIFPVVIASFVRVVTNRRVFAQPTELSVALDFVNSLLSAGQVHLANAGPRHLVLFLELCQRVGARGDLVQDAYLAALALEQGCVWVSTDRDFARFPNLRWQHPFEPKT